MDSASTVHLPLLVNTLGHIFGLAAFSGFLYFLWHSRRRSLGGDIRLPGGAALLALLGFSALRGHLQKWVERRVFRRGEP